MPKKKDFKVAVQGADKLFSANDIAASFKTAKELKINPAYKNLIPPLSTDEYLQLEANLVESGIREPISTWKDTIIDGHNRYELAQKHNLPFPTEEYDFTNENDAIQWIINNQLGRRNLLPWHRSKLALELKPIIAEKGKERQSAAGAPLLQNSVKAPPTDEKVLLQNSAKALAEPVDTRKELAGIAGVSHDTIARVEKILQTGTPKTLEQLELGEISINKAYQEVRAQERKSETATSAIALNNTFNVIYVNAPWDADKRPAEITFDDAKNLKIPTEEDAVLFLWSSSPNLEKSLRLMNAWGFKYKTNLIWDKTENHANAFIRGQHNILLIGIKGKFPLPDVTTGISSVYREESNDHSDKPKWFYEQIEKFYPNGKFLEIFSSQAFNSKWNIWENKSTPKEKE